MLPDDPRIAALEALFVVTDLGTGRHRLTVPEIASGGIGDAEDDPVGTIGYVSRVKAALVGAILRRLDEAAPAPPAACTGTTAKWCPVHGDCACPEDERRPGERTFDDPRCPLHAPASDHGEKPEPGAVLAGIVRGEEHERAALVRERDEAVAAAEVLAKRLAAAEEEAARLRIEAIGRGRHSAQLALFAPPAADPAGEAQRAANSGAAVGAIVGAAADAPAPKPAKVPAPVCAPCGGVPLVPAADMPREGEATGGKPLGCPACGEGYDGTPEQIARALADSEAATKRIAAAEGKCSRCWGPRHRGRCKGAR